jgi:hypothetical protein
MQTYQPGGKNWTNQEGLIPEKETFKGFRGLVLWIVLAVASYLILWKPLCEKLANNLGSTVAMSDFDSILYYFVYPALKYILTILFACIVKGIVNHSIKKRNQKIFLKNETILSQNEAYDSSTQEPVNADAHQALLARMEKAQHEMAKYEGFIKKKDFDHSFYHWKKWYAIIVAFVAYFGTSLVAYAVVLIVAVFASILCSFAGIEPSDTVGQAFVSSIQVIAIILAVLVAIGSFPFAKRMQKKADRLQEEDDKNGYTEALNRVMWDVPARYRRVYLLKRLTSIIKHKNLTTVAEAIEIRERRIETAKGVIKVLYLLAFFGMVNAVNNAFDEWERTSDDIASDIGKRFDESRAEDMRIRANDRAMKDYYNKLGNAAESYRNAAANAKSLRGTSNYGAAQQYKNQAKRVLENVRNNKPF